MAVQEEGSIRREARFLGSPGGKLLALTHLPQAPPRAAVVLCSPILAELTSNTGRERALADRLAARGIAAQRFHYRGEGNSEGEGISLTFPSMCRDTALVADWVSGLAGVGRMSFVGTRLGALVAGEVAARFPGAPLVLWEPVTDPVRYFREVFRSRLIRDLAAGRTRPSDTDPGEQMHRLGWVDVLGFPIHRALYESCLSQGVEGVADREVLVVQVSGSERLRPDYAALVEQLASAGCRVESRVVEGKVAWWFAGGSLGEVDEATLMAVTSHWLEERLA